MNGVALATLEWPTRRTMENDSPVRTVPVRLTTVRTWLEFWLGKFWLSCARTRLNNMPIGEVTDFPCMEVAESKAPVHAV